MGEEFAEGGIGVAVGDRAVFVREATDRAEAIGVVEAGQVGAVGIRAQEGEEVVTAEVVGLEGARFVGFRDDLRE